MPKNLVRTTWLVLLAAGCELLNACGGGGNAQAVNGAAAGGNTGGGSGGTASGGGNGGTTTNGLPAISGTPRDTVLQGQAYLFQPSASDPDNDPLTYGIANKPGWATFSASTGALSGTPSAADVGTYSNVTISVSDGHGGSTSLASFSISVVDVAQGSVTLSWTPPTSNEDGSPLNDLAGYRIYWGTAQGVYQNSAPIDNPGMATYVLDNLTPNKYYFVATAVDTSGNESAFSTVASKTIQ
jgi:putative Ig domain-containing protein